MWVWVLLSVAGDMLDLFLGSFAVNFMVIDELSWLYVGVGIGDSVLVIVVMLGVVFIDEDGMLVG